MKLSMKTSQISRNKQKKEKKKKRLLKSFGSAGGEASHYISFRVRMLQCKKYIFFEETAYEFAGAFFISYVICIETRSCYFAEAGLQWLFMGIIIVYSSLEFLGSSKLPTSPPA